MNTGNKRPSQLLTARQRARRGEVKKDQNEPRCSFCKPTTDGTKQSPEVCVRCVDASGARTNVTLMLLRKI